MRSLLTLAVVGLCACATRPRDPVLDSYPSGVSGLTSITYYDIHGRTVAELRADIRRQGPKIGDSSFVGESRSPMRWTWRTQPEGTSSCSFKDVRVYVNAQILLPRWVPPADTEPGFFAEWNRFMAALEAHEAGHKNISAKAASEIIKSVSALSGSCSFIGTRAADIARVIVDRARDEQQRYDGETRHGLTQGTAFAIRRSTAAPVDASGALIFPKNGATLAPRPGAIQALLLVSMEAAWRVLPVAYTSVGLGVTTTDSASHTVVYTGTLRPKIGEAPLSTYFDCGTAPADVSVIVATQLGADLAGKTMVMIVTYATVPSDGVAATMCQSNGMLERRILQALRAELGRS